MPSRRLGAKRSKPRVREYPDSPRAPVMVRPGGAGGAPECALAEGGRRKRDGSKPSLSKKVLRMKLLRGRIGLLSAAAFLTALVHLLVLLVLVVREDGLHLLVLLLHDGLHLLVYLLPV